MTESLLLSLGERGPFSEEEFNDWYDNEHIPNLLSLPGYTAAQRYIQNDTRKPTYLTLYNYTSNSSNPVSSQTNAFNTPEMINYAANLSEREKRIISNVPYINRRIYKPIFQLPSSSRITRSAAKYLFTVEADLKDASPEFEEEFNKWCNTTHIPCLSKTEGWVSSRRFQLELYEELGADAPLPEHAATKYISIHEFDSSDYREDQGLMAAVRGEGAQKMADSKVKFDLRHFVLHKDFY
ncbi:hypothetical protein CVT24_007146 [Panaeolus cyanescens]|uniref:EthD domain-containing protein n=1 Tax=Panaeolus cyanescens TaxID=181874 RepID=A0A409YPF6_9AGAR|nr:hypothetical protein CVT24_007146 [Panaeolus cyanescens]